MMQNTVKVEIPISEILREYSNQLISLIQSNQKNEESIDNEFRYYNRKETAKILNISLVTLNEHTKRGLIKASRLGRRVLYSQESIQEALKAIKTP